MNNTILMVWSGELCRQFCSLIKRNVFVSGPGKAASYRYQISLNCLQVDKTNKGNETMLCNKVCVCVCVEQGIPYHGPSLIKPQDMKPTQQVISKITYSHDINNNVSVPELEEGHFQCRSNTEDLFRAAEIRKHQYLKSHYHEQTPFLSLNYKSVNSLIYLLCPWPIFFEEKRAHFSRDIDILTVF